MNRRPLHDTPATRHACVVRLLALCAWLPFSACSSFQDVRDVAAAQNTPGFYPKALYYCGSDDMAHYFEQETPLGDLTPATKSVRTFMVDRRTLTIPDGAEFSRESFTGRNDDRRRLMVIHPDSPQARRGWAEYPLYDPDKA